MFDTPDGRAQFTPHALPAMEVQSDQYVMMTLRSHDQYNTTIYGLHDRYRGIHGHRRVVLMNAEDMVDRGWKARQLVDITSHFNGEQRRSDRWLLVPYEIPRGNLATYFPEANSLVPFTPPQQSQTHRHQSGLCALCRRTSLVTRRSEVELPLLHSTCPRKTRIFASCGLLQSYRCLENGSTPLLCSS